MNDQLSAVYVHVPFCIGKCAYCDFFSVVDPGSIPDYLKALALELDITMCERSEPVRTVYIGGGTPTSFDPDQLGELLTLVTSAVRMVNGVEFTVEANPGTLTPAKLRILSDAGVNRLSIGVQSFNDRLLRTLGRRHTREDALTAIGSARDAGFNNLTLDLIFGIPTQTREEWQQDLAELLACDVPHVSTYCLTWEKGTPLSEVAELGDVSRLSEDDELWMYEEAIRTLTDAGYAHYEISNFARDGFESEHNHVYWANMSYLGLGPAAASYINGERRGNFASIEKYCAALRHGKLPIESRERLSAEKSARETAVMNLRRTRGIDFGEFALQTGFDLDGLLGDVLQALIRQGFMETDSGSVWLSHSGMMVADSVMAELV